MTHRVEGAEMATEITAASLLAAGRRAGYATPRPEDDGDAYSTDPLDL